MNRGLIAGLILALLFVSAASFYGGMLYGKGQATAAIAPAAGAMGAFAPGQSGGRQGQAQGGAVFGQVSEIGADYLLVSDNSGNQTRVQVTDTTLMQKQTTASLTLADFQKGDTVIVSGSRDSDGVVTARSVQAGMAGFSAQPAAGQPGANPRGGGGAAPGGAFPGRNP